MHLFFHLFQYIGIQEWRWLTSLSWFLFHLIFEIFFSFNHSILFPPRLNLFLPWFSYALLLFLCFFFFILLHLDSNFHFCLLQNVLLFCLTFENLLFTYFKMLSFLYMSFTGHFLKFQLGQRSNLSIKFLPR